MSSQVGVGRPALGAWSRACPLGVWVGVAAGPLLRRAGAEAEAFFWVLSSILGHHPLDASSSQPPICDNQNVS